MKYCTSFLALFILAAGAVSLFGQNGESQDDNWKFKGQIQLRSEIDDRDFDSDTRAETFTSLRTRFGVGKSIAGKVHLFVQAQDSRVLGSEPNTLTPIANLDLHQAYARINEVLGLPVDAQAGRFEMVYGTQRFIGAVGWHFVGRSFDGARFMYNNGFKADFFSTILTEQNTYVGNANPGAYPVPAQSDSSNFLHGLWTSFDVDDANQVDVFALLELNTLESNGRDNNLQRTTAGVNYFGSFGDLSATVEAAYQTGTQGAVDANSNPVEKDIASYLVSLVLKYKADAWTFGVGADMLSGTDPADAATDNNTFATPFATNHKFYGYMDYFINTITNTGGLGLRDLYLMLNWNALPDELKVALAAHLFSSSQESANGNSDFGQEIDLTLNYSVIKGTNVILGASIFAPGDLMKAAFGNREDTGMWAYLMLVANL